MWPPPARTMGQVLPKHGPEDPSLGKDRRLANAILTSPHFDTIPQVWRILGYLLLRLPRPVTRWTDNSITLHYPPCFINERPSPNVHRGLLISVSLLYRIFWFVVLSINAHDCISCGLFGAPSDPTALRHHLKYRFFLHTDFTIEVCQQPTQFHLPHPTKPGPDHHSNSPTPPVYRPSSLT